MIELQRRGVLGAPPADSPALVLDALALRRNLRRMRDRCRAAGVGLRPHVGPHRCRRVAELQLTFGALGVTCSTLPEAEELVATLTGRRPDSILVESPVAGADTARRLAQLSKRAPILSLVSAREQAEQLAAIARSEAGTVSVLVDIQPPRAESAHRTQAETVALVRAVYELSGLRFRGISARDDAAAAVRHAEAVRDAYIPVEIVSVGAYGAGGPPAVAGLSEIRAGAYASPGAADPLRAEGYEPTVLVVGTVVDRSDTRVVLDIGWSALNAGESRPEVWGLPDAAWVAWTRESAGLDLGEAAHAYPPGTRLAFVPADPSDTGVLYRHFHAMGDGRTHGRWPLLAHLR